jgi:two-component system, chemotaxis family, chemotaxis protein CheY
MFDLACETPLRVIADRLPEALVAPAVLVIDDDPVHRMVLCKTAERAGFVATAAATFGAAISFLRRNSYAAITLDLSLGTRNGLDVLHALAEMRCPTPIVIVSGTSAGMRTEMASLAGLMHLDVRHTMAKPVDLALLRHALTAIRHGGETPVQHLTA